MKNYSTPILEKAADRDAYISQKLRERRIHLKLKQRDVADKIGVSTQQIHKYEKGIDRITAGRLFEIAQVLSVPLEFFYRDAVAPTSFTSPHELVITCKNQMGKKIKIEFLNLDVVLSEV
jgi:transcriptional regulator with XRE-family HTH domain